MPHSFNNKKNNNQSYCSFKNGGHEETRTPTR